MEEDLDVALVNYQKFIRKETGQERIDQLLTGRYGLMIIDEVHQSNATSFARFVKSLDTKFKLGLSATPDRKDCLEENTKIYTNKGVMSIKEIIGEYEKNKNSILIYSKNMATGEIELKPILEVHKVSAENKELSRVNNSFICTNDHEFL